MKEEETPLSEPMRRAWLPDGERSTVFRRGNVVVRDASPWTLSIHALLRHLADQGFEAAPKLVGTGIDDDGRENLEFVEGEFMHPGPWSIEGLFELGRLVRRLHDAVASFRPSSDMEWPPWFGRDIGDGSATIVSHCDLAPWNIVARDGMPVAFIDWEYTGPVEPMVELAQVCWLNAKLHGDEVAGRENLPPLHERAKHLNAILDGYELEKPRRDGFVDRMVQFAACDAAEQADEANVTAETTDPEALWGLAWRSRAAAWMVRNRRYLQSAIS